MGPKLFHVPVLLGFAYIGMAYVSWRSAGAILPRRSNPRGSALSAAFAALVMTAWDLAQDPVWATVLHGWVWRDGGPWFGVPISNYFGWYGTIFLIYLLFALYLRRSPAPARRVPARPAPRNLLLLLCALGNVLQIFSRRSRPGSGPHGRFWRVAEYYCLDPGFFVVMGGFAAMAWLRSKAQPGHYRLNSSRSLRVCDRLTGISVCRLSSIRNW